MGRIEGVNGWADERVDGRGNGWEAGRRSG